MKYIVYTGPISVIYFEEVKGDIGPAQLQHEVKLIVEKFNLYPPTTAVLHQRIASEPIPPAITSAGGFAGSNIENILDPLLIPMSIASALLDRCEKLIGLDENYKKYVVVDPDEEKPLLEEGQSSE